jgi:hypothetical protein
MVPNYACMVNTLRQRLSRRLLEAGAAQSLECREMWAKCQRPGVRAGDNADLQLIALLQVISDAAIRLGVRIMPNRSPF